MSSGRRLSAAARREGEQRLGPLPDVRLHDDANARWFALSLGARAVTVGNHIYTGPGAFDGAYGRRLLLHELTHVVSQDPALGHRKTAVEGAHPAESHASQVEQGRQVRIGRVPVGAYRSPLPWSDFLREMRRLGVERIFEGTFDQQRDRINHFGAGQRPGDLLARESWTAWSPGTDSAVYDWIVAAFAALARAFGGVPAVREIAFYEVEYDTDRQGRLVRRPNVAAMYGGGLMAVYKTAVDRATSIPTGRSADGARAELRRPTQQQGLLTAVVHELGHGLVETALTPRPDGAPDPRLGEDYRRAVGWTTGSSPALYDAGVAEVRAALDAGGTPPDRYRITEANWNDARWVEQPVSAYMTTHPSEDMPEAIAYYVTQPDLLRARSPRRHEFVSTRFTALRSHLRPDRAAVRLVPTDAELRRVLEEADVPPWLQRDSLEPTDVGARSATPRSILEIRF